MKKMVENIMFFFFKMDCIFCFERYYEFCFYLSYIELGEPSPDDIFWVLNVIYSIFSYIFRDAESCVCKFC